MICINKCDLVAPVRLQPIVGIYARLGYEIVLASASASVGIDELAGLLQGRETVVAGQSGVGNQRCSMRCSRVSAWKPRR